MPMNKHPERTVEKILKVSEELFVTNGYYNTSMQDIIDGLNPDLTKGAIYYHFKSRDDIFYRIVSDKCMGIYSDIDEIIARDDLNGKQKFEMVLDTGGTSKGQEELFKFYSAVNPKDGSGQSIIVAYAIKFAEVEIIPRLKLILREGSKDGSVKCKYPNEMAELIGYLATVWLSGKMGLVETDVYMRKLNFLDKLFRQYGVELISDEAKAIYVKAVAKNS
ncbi:MAG: TetR/AcrR family transcriptional regulator [Eubacterium sp.]|nr:TetR/AcrR family transcriptional regulator [Candidatus Colimonas fimequi]